MLYKNKSKSTSKDEKMSPTEYGHIMSTYEKGATKVRKAINAHKVARKTKFIKTKNSKSTEHRKLKGPRLFDVNSRKISSDLPKDKPNVSKIYKPLLHKIGDQPTSCK